MVQETEGEKEGTEEISTTTEDKKWRQENEHRTRKHKKCKKNSHTQHIHTYIYTHQIYRQGHLMHQQHTRKSHLVFGNHRQVVSVNLFYIV